MKNQLFLENLPIAAKEPLRIGVVYYGLNSSLKDIIVILAGIDPK